MADDDIMHMIDMEIRINKVISGMVKNHKSMPGMTLSTKDTLNGLSSL